jgi:competence protein ComEC
MNATGAVRAIRIVVLVVTLTACACHDAPPEGWDRPADSTLRIMHIDVGQGDATLLLGPDGTAVLVDAGSAEAGARVADALAEAGVQSLAVVFVTHPDADHAGGLPAVIAAGIGVRVAYSEGTSSTSETYQALTDSLSGTEAGGLTTLEPGTRFDLGDGVVVTCSISAGRLMDGSRVLVSTTNDRSLGLWVTYGGFDYHVGGDLGQEVETALGPVVGDLDVLHLHHHGSDGSTAADWLAATRPEVAVLSVGPNSYGHPAAEVVDRLAGIELVQTGEGERPAGRVLGSFSIFTDGQTYRLDGRTREVDE